MGLLDNILGGGRQRGGAMSPLTMALMGLLAYRTMKGKGRLADMLGTGSAGAAGGAGFGGMLGGLGGLFGGGGLSEGLGHLLNRFQENGQGDKARSWVSHGPNEPVSPGELEQGLGEERIAWLMQQTGMSREELLAGLSRELPDVVDKLTPQGRLPTPQEAQGLI